LEATTSAGFHRYGRQAEAARLAGGLFEASLYFESGRLPELFAGFERERFGVPVPYPVACHPQAWSAGAALHLLQTCLGLQAQAFERKLLVERPALPPGVDWVEVDSLRVGGSEARLRYTREPGEAVRVEVLGVTGEPLDVVVS
jgi:glycogen debranching enzyme